MDISELNKSFDCNLPFDKLEEIFYNQNSNKIKLYVNLGKAIIRVASFIYLYQNGYALNTNDASKDLKTNCIRILKLIHNEYDLEKYRKQSSKYITIAATLIVLIYDEYGFHETYKFLLPYLSKIYFDYKNIIPPKKTTNFLKYPQEIEYTFILLDISKAYISFFQMDEILNIFLNLKYDGYESTRNLYSGIGAKILSMLCWEYIIDNYDILYTNTYCNWFAFLLNNDNISRTISEECIEYFQKTSSLPQDYKTIKKVNTYKIYILKSVLGVMWLNSVFDYRSDIIKYIKEYIFTKFNKIKDFFFNQSNPNNIENSSLSTINIDNQNNSIMLKPQQNDEHPVKNTFLNTPIPSEVSFDCSENVLYICKGITHCRNNNHRIISATGILASLKGNQIKINVNYCTSCNIYFISYSEYSDYRNTYGIMLGNFNIKDSTNYNFSKNSYYDNFNKESILHTLGYNVSQTENLSPYERHKILCSLMDYNIISKPRIIDYLQNFINNSKNRPNMKLACQKWKDDLNWVRNYEIDKQRHFIVSSIKKYK